MQKLTKSEVKTHLISPECAPCEPGPFRNPGSVGLRECRTDGRAEAQSFQATFLTRATL